MLLVNGNWYGGIYHLEYVPGNHTLGNSLVNSLLQSTHCLKSVALSVVSSQ